MADRFPAEGSGLARYAGVLSGVEINTSFYRPHKPETYARWAATTPEGFRFAVKAPKAATHELRLVDAFEPIDRFLGETAALGEKRGPVLLQLPPSLAFDHAVAARFLEGFRARYAGDAAMEPRHASWFDTEADALLTAHRVARAAADPAPCPEAASPGGWGGLRYWRLHGSPRMYWSPYAGEALSALAESIQQAAAPAWVVFDNTASGAAAADALRLTALLGAPPCVPTAKPEH